jgi:drug/metabolite transporter (DMT)-like permease
LVHVFAVAAACLLGLGFVLQQEAAARAPVPAALSPRILWRLAHEPRWLAGIACMVGGQVLSGTALLTGDLSVVEPLLTTSLLWAMLLARWLSGERLGLAGWAGVLLLSGGVLTFMLVGRPVGTDDPVGPVRHWAVFGTVAAVAVALFLVGRHVRPADDAFLLAVAGGVFFGLQDALTRVSGRVLTESGTEAMLRSWQTYGIVVAAVAGLTLVQNAFRAGPLWKSLPMMTVAEALAGITCGIGYLGDRVRLAPEALAVEAAGLVAVAAGLLLIGRHPAMPAGARVGSGQG